MGTRSAAKIKLRAALFKCDVCGRRLMSAEALKSHQEGVHNATAKVKTKALLKSPLTKPKHQSAKIKNVKLNKIAIGKPKSGTPRKATITSKPAAKTKTPSKSTPISNSVGSNVQYECPKCMKTFSIYFSAHRHIQKCHCVNSAGEKVLPNSPDLIKPVKRNLCPRCKKQIMAEETHMCVNLKLVRDLVDPSWFYVCAGCKQQFNSLKLFDLHVSGLHYKGVESMFFPSDEEFQEWKTEMEKLSMVRYSILGRSTFKEMYRCTFLPDGGSECDDRTSIVCPSTIVVQEFSKGIQVHFYKDHHEHKFQKYVLPEKFKKYSLTTLLQNAEGYTQINELKVDENDLYLQFKKLMECIVLDAAKINLKMLKVLIGKALDMTSVLNSYEEDPDSDSFSAKKAVDFNISWSVGNDKTVAEKRKVENEDKTQTEPITKRFKTRMYQYNPSDADGNASNLHMLQDSTIKIINSFSLADKDISKAVNEMDSESDTQSKHTKKEPESNSNSSSPFPDEDVKDELMTPIKTKKKIADNSSPTSFNDSYKDFVSKNFKMTPAKSKTKTKMIASTSKSKHISPKGHNVAKESKTSSPFQPSLPVKREPSDTPLIKPVDIKYEVKEQENDCNILILKI